jgi:hypothetical protein
MLDINDSNHHCFESRDTDFDRSAHEEGTKFELHTYC